MRRNEATKRLLTIVERAAAGGELCELVDEIYVFGSYARGALEPGDLDVSVSYHTTEEESRKWVAALFQGRDRTLDLRRALRGSWRSVEMQFNNANELRLADFEPLLVWRRGEPVSAACERLAAIAVDANAGTAARDPVIAALDGLDEHVPRPLREEAALLDHLALACFSRIELPDAEPSSAWAKEMIEVRWSETNSKRRAARAAAAWLERCGYRVDFVRNDLCSDETNRAEHDREIAKAVVYFGGRWLGEAAAMLASGSDEALVVVNASARKAPLIGLHIERIAPVEQLEDVIFAIEHGGERRQALLARLVREREDASLPETLHSFVCYHGLDAGAFRQDEGGHG